MDAIENFFNNKFFIVLARIWNLTLFSIDNSSITVGTIVVGSAFFVVGLYVSKRISKKLMDRMAQKTSVDLGTRYALEKLSFYLFFVLFSLFAMKLAHIPLTAFTVIGGALAIGVGFGSQNIVNNFISGIIIMFERPIKVGDFIEVDGLIGHIEQIGMRSTHIKTIGNRHIIVPNSHFLEKNVLNWTFADRHIRISIAIGVAYGSNTQKVKEILLASVKEHEKSIVQRENNVYFKDFGDNALHFEVFFWINLTDINDRWQIESDMRFEIDRRFREANIVIAFPQRDLHLFTSEKGIKVRLENTDPEQKV